ncbi:MAG: response regulator [Alphaproteobacteria bacterium]
MRQMSDHDGRDGSLRGAAAALGGSLARPLGVFRPARLTLARAAVFAIAVLGMASTLTAGFWLKDYVDYLHRSNGGYGLIEAISVEAAKVALRRDAAEPADEALARALDALSQAAERVPSVVPSTGARALLDAGRALYFAGPETTRGTEERHALALDTIRAAQDLQAAAARRETAVLRGKGLRVGLAMAVNGLLWSGLVILLMAVRDRVLADDPRGRSTTNPSVPDSVTTALPLTAATGRTSRSSGSSVSTGPAFGSKVLIVEDNPINQKIAAAMLASQGVAFDMVENGAEAVEQVQSGVYGVVLMDVQMPIMDGLEATRRIRALPGPISRIPIIAVTANAMEGDRETYLNTGMDDFVPKPIDPSALISVVEGHLSGDEQETDRALSA